VATCPFLPRLPVSAALLALAPLAPLAALAGLAQACDAGKTSSPPIVTHGRVGDEAPKADQLVPAVDVLERVTGSAKATDTLPMVVVIHGRGDRPESFVGLLEGLDRPARIIAPRGPTPWNQGYSWFALRDSLSDEEVARGIVQAADAIATTLRRLLLERPTQGKPIITGFSQGGALSFALAIRHPDLVAGAFPLGGWVPPSLLPAPGAATAPMVALHGEADERIPVGPTRDAVTTLRQRGARVEFRTYPGVGHSVSAEMRRDLELLLRETIGPAPR